MDKVANAVKVTLGPKGRNVVLGSGFGSPTITNDGVTIAKDIELEDNVENIGAEIIKEVASKTNDIAGDGTTSAVLLCQAIATEGLKNVAAGANPLALRKGIIKAKDAVVAGFKRNVKTNFHKRRKSAGCNNFCARCRNGKFDCRSYGRSWKRRSNYNRRIKNFWLVKRNCKRFAV